MDTSLLKKLETEPLPRVLLVHGPESFWQDRLYSVLKNRMAQESFGQWNWSLFHGSKDLDLEPVLTELATLPWGGTAKLVVLREAHLVPGDTMEKLAKWLEENPQANSLALFYHQLDQRWRYLKLLRQFALEVECSALRGEELADHVAKYCAGEGKKIEQVAVQLFFTRVGTNLQVIHNELDKLIAYVGERTEISAQDVEAVTSLWPEQIANHAVFQLTDFIAQKKRREALGMLQQLLAAGEAPLRILALIERQLRLLLAAKTSSNLDGAAAAMGESSAYPLKKVRAQARRFSLDELFAGFHAVVQADGEIKLGASGEEVLTDLIIKLT